MFKRLLTAALAVSLTAGGIVLAGAPAQAATPKVTIKTIATASVGYTGTATVKPRVTASGPVSVRSKKLSVTKQGTKVATSKSSVTLKRGTYKVTTVVTYKVKKKGRLGATKTTKKTQTLKVVRPKGCALKSDYDAVATVEMYENYEVDVVDDVVSAAATLQTRGSSEVSLTLWEFHDFLVEDGDVESAAFIEELAEMYGWSAILEYRTYPLCSKKQRAEVMYVGDDAWFKEIVSPDSW